MGSNWLVKHVYKIVIGIKDFAALQIHKTLLNNKSCGKQRLSHLKQIATLDHYHMSYHFGNLINYQSHIIVIAKEMKQTLG